MKLIKFASSQFLKPLIKRFKSKLLERNPKFKSQMKNLLDWKTSLIGIITALLTILAYVDDWAFLDKIRIYVVAAGLVASIILLFLSRSSFVDNLDSIKDILDGVNKINEDSDDKFQGDVKPEPKAKKGLLINFVKPNKTALALVGLSTSYLIINRYEIDPSLIAMAYLPAVVLDEGSIRQLFRRNLIPSVPRATFIATQRTSNGLYIGVTDLKHFPSRMSLTYMPSTCLNDRSYIRTYIAKSGGVVQIGRIEGTGPSDVDKTIDLDLKSAVLNTEYSSFPGSQLVSGNGIRPVACLDPEKILTQISRGDLNGDPDSFKLEESIPVGGQLHIQLLSKNPIVEKHLAFSDTGIILRRPRVPSFRANKGFGGCRIIITQPIQGSFDLKLDYTLEGASEPSWLKGVHASLSRTDVGGGNFVYYYSGISYGEGCSWQGSKAPFRFLPASPSSSIPDNPGLLDVIAPSLTFFKNLDDFAVLVACPDAPQIENHLFDFIVGSSPTEVEDVQELEARVYLNSESGKEEVDLNLRDYPVCDTNFQTFALMPNAYV